MEDLEDTTECGVRCQLSGDTCNFFTTADGKCHLGRYTHWDSGEVESTAVPMTYHKYSKLIVIFAFNFFYRKLHKNILINIDQIQWVKNDNFKWWSSGNYWYKW